MFYAAHPEDVDRDAIALLLHAKAPQPVQTYLYQGYPKQS